MATEKEVKDYKDAQHEREPRTIHIDSDVLTEIQTIKVKYRKLKLKTTLNDIYNIEMRKALGLPIKKK